VKTDKKGINSALGSYMPAFPASDVDKEVAVTEWQILLLKTKNSTAACP
jgi:hypothetical protein